MEKKTKQTLQAALLSCLLSVTTLAYAETNSTEWSAWKQWPTVGQARLTWFVFDVYESKLLSPTGRFELKEDITPHPLALEISYLRDISSRDLINATEEQWSDMGIEYQKQWKETLAMMFPDIRKGDVLTYVTDGEIGKLVFMATESQSEEIIGHVTDRELNDAFLAIWLSPNSQYPALRKQLIGQKSN